MPPAVARAIGTSFSSGIHVALWVSGIMLLVGSPIAFVTIRGTAPHHVAARAAAAEAEPIATAEAKS